MFARWLLRLEALFRRQAVEAAFDEELRFHLERETERNLARGMSPDEARRAARRAFGDPGRLKEEARETWRWRWLDELLQDLRYGGRGLRRNLGFTAVAVLSLGFGIGATTTLFGVVDALDFRPLPFPDAERLVWLGQVLPPDNERCPGCPWTVSPSTAAEWRARARSYEATGFWSRSTAYFRQGDVAQWVNVGHATPGFFEVLGVRPPLGREFVRDDALEGSEPVALLTHATWQRVFGGDPEVLGMRLEYFGDVTLSDARSATVVGVLPEDFRFDGRTSAFWIPFPGGGGAPGSRFANVLGRLKPGVGLPAAEAELASIAGGLSASDADAYRDVTVRPLRERLSWGAGDGRAILFGVTMLVLLIAVMNVAGLSLARTLSRRGELTVRRTLGARRLRLVRQLLVEGMLLGVIGGGVGALVMIWGVRAARIWFRVESSAASPELDHRILIFGAGLSVLVGVAADVERGEMVERHWPTVSRPLAQAPLYHPAATLYVRLTNPSGAVLSTLQSTLRRALGHPTSAIRPVEQDLAERFRTQRFNAVALNLFAAFALLLAAIGIYGSVAYAVAQRTRELAIRVALGAGKRRVLRLVAGRATLVAAAGVALGLLGSVALARLLGAFVAATSVTNPWMFAGSALVMGVVALAAAYIPARRVTAVDPMIALRSE